MIDELIKLANYLDRSGLKREADQIDALIKNAFAPLGPLAIEALLAGGATTTTTGMSWGTIAAFLGLGTAAGGTAYYLSRESEAEEALRRLEETYNREEGLDPDQDNDIDSDYEGYYRGPDLYQLRDWVDENRGVVEREVASVITFPGYDKGEDLEDLLEYDLDEEEIRSMYPEIDLEYINEEKSSEGGISFFAEGSNYHPGYSYHIFGGGKPYAAHILTELDAAEEERSYGRVADLTRWGNVAYLGKVISNIDPQLIRADQITHEICALPRFIIWMQAAGTKTFCAYNLSGGEAGTTSEIDLDENGTEEFFKRIYTSDQIDPCTPISCGGLRVIK